MSTLVLNNKPRPEMHSKMKVTCPYIAKYYVRCQRYWELSAKWGQCKCSPSNPQYDSAVIRGISGGCHNWYLMMPRDTKSDPCCFCNLAPDCFTTFYHFLILSEWKKVSYLSHCISCYLQFQVYGNFSLGPLHK